MRVLAVLVLACAALLSAQTTSLSTLITEAEAHNPAVAAATAAWRAAAASVAPAGALPDPQVMVQQMSVGNPLPFAGYTSSNFAYVGVGASQSVPYPGKRKLRTAAAADEADAVRAQIGTVRRLLREQVAAAYFDLAYEEQDRILLDREQQVLAAVEEQAESRYGSGMGSQADVLTAQLEQSQLLRQVADQNEREAEDQAQLRALLDRPQASAPIVPEPLRLTRAAAPAAQLQTALAAAPDLAAGRAEVSAAETRVALARKNFLPDFNLQYMVQRTGPHFPDYYQWTVGVNIPLHRKSRLEPELEAATENKLQAQAQLQSQARQDAWALQQAQLRADNDRRQLKLDNDALLPQVRAAAAAHLAAYAAGRGALSDVLLSEREALELERQSWRTLADHEIALSQVTALTGVSHE